MHNSFDRQKISYIWDNRNTGIRSVRREIFNIKNELKFYFEFGTFRNY